MHRLSFKDMSKAYGGVPALSDVSLTLDGGKIHALMGENGAGKSTLIKLIAGVVPADCIRVAKDGEEIPIASPQDAQDAGFRFIHQELNIVPQVSVAENILLGHRYPRRFGVAVDWKQVRAQARRALEFLGADHIDVKAFAGSLPPGDKMLIRIAAALVTEEGPEAVLYVLDEPTAALTEQESEMLFTVIERLRNSGSAVLYVSHRMDEVMRICDHVTVLRDGKHVSTSPVADTSMDVLIRDMTGREVRAAYPPRIETLGVNIVAKLDHVQTPHLQNLNIELNEGEILGVAGLAEAGQSELLRLFMGLEPVLSGTGTYINRSLPNSPSDAWARQIAYIPRERRGDALMLDMPIRSNIVLPHLGRYGAKANKKVEAVDAAALASKVRLKYEGLDQPVAQLSGGNQQKVVFARALFGHPKLLLLEEPTRGVDVGAKYDIYMLVRELSAKGCTVILTSTDLPEILGMCDRILVLQEGRQEHLLNAEHLTSAELLSYFYQSEAA